MMIIERRTLYVSHYIRLKVVTARFYQEILLKIERKLKVYFLSYSYYIIGFKINILIFCDIEKSFYLYLLYHSRLASIQILYNSYDLSFSSIDYIISIDKKEKTEYYRTQHILFTTSTMNLPKMSLANDKNGSDSSSSRSRYGIFNDDDILFMLYLVDDTLYKEYVIVFRNILRNVLNSKMILLIKYFIFLLKYE